MQPKVSCRRKDELVSSHYYSARELMGRDKLDELTGAIVSDAMNVGERMALEAIH